MSQESKSNDDVPFETQRAINTASLFCEILHEFCKNNCCPFIEDSDGFAKDILDHVIIVGGFPRDILLEEPINDIDILINLRELNKLQYNHLMEHHNNKEGQSEKAEKCLFWQRYLNKFHKNQKKKKISESNMVDMHNCNYILNSNFFIMSVLLTDERLGTIYSVQDQPKHGFFSTEIVNKIIYKDINIDGQLIEFYDTFDVNFEEEHDKTVYSQYHTKQRKASMGGQDINIDNIFTHSHHHHNHNENGGHKRLQSMKITNNLNATDFSSDLMDDGTDVNIAYGGYGTRSRDEHLSIEVPIYNTKIGDRLEHYDFSINTAIIDFCSISSLNGLTNINKWKSIITNGCPDECDAIKDIVNNKILRFPEDECEEHVIALHPVGYHFWRIIKWMISHRKFKLDNKLIEVHKKHYSQWLNLTYFSSQINILSFLNDFMDILQNSCKSYNDVEQVLYIMDKLSFHNKFILLINKSANLKSELISSVYKITNNNFNYKPKQILNLFENKYNYPSLQNDHDNLSLERENKLLLQEIKILERENSVLQRENRLYQTQQQQSVFQSSASSSPSSLEIRINDLENKFSAHLNELEGDNKSLKKENETLKDENKYLKQQLNNVIEAQKQLAVNSDNAIQELREIIKRYQNKGSNQ